MNNPIIFLLSCAILFSILLILGYLIINNHKEYNKKLSLKISILKDDNAKLREELERLRNKNKKLEEFCKSKASNDSIMKNQIYNMLAYNGTSVGQREVKHEN